jgi:hypothetical protein
MQDEQYEMTLGEGVGKRVMTVRLLIGLVQGLLLYWLYQSAKDNAWPATAPYLMVPLFTLGLMLPALLISSLGHMAPKKTALWALGAGVVMLLLSLHDAWRSVGMGGFTPFLSGRPSPYLPSWPLLIYGGVLLYIAHALVMAAVFDGRRIASYASYFEMAWKLAVQLMFSVFFVGVLWLVLWMGASLFSLVKLNFLKDLLKEALFVVPVICFAWSCAMHVTDVRPSIVRGIRTLLLVLLSWILPVAALIVLGFLCSLPFTGMEALWGTRQATSLLLTADAVLIVLINAAFQNGDAKAVLIIRVSARCAAMLLLPLTAIAIYALGLRVYDYGWTVDRIIAAACLVVAGCYSAGYAWAAQSYDTWLYPITKVNIATAFVVLAVLLALFTPIADPARLSVNNQVARLAKGRTLAEKFDYRYLRFEGQRYGHAALEQLVKQGVGANPKLVSEKAAAALKETNRWGGEKPIAPDSITENVTVWPGSAQLPASFVAQKWAETAKSALEQPPCLINANLNCEALVRDMDGDGKLEVLLFSVRFFAPAVLYTEQADGKWVAAGRLGTVASGCQPLRDRLKAGEYKFGQSRWKSLEVAGHTLPFQAEFTDQDCKSMQPAK